MPPEEDIPSRTEEVSISEPGVSVAEATRLPEGDTPPDMPEARRQEGRTESKAEAYDFRNRLLIAPGDLRKLRQHQERFTDALGSRLTLLLRMEATLKLVKLQTISYRTLARNWRNPTHLTQFKLDPLKGLSVIEVPPSLASCMVDRLMGGPGRPAEGAQELSEVERALLEQAVMLILGEWCVQWNRIKELKPVLLGSETDGNFVNAAAADATMLVLGLQTRIGECEDQILVGFPFTTVEPLIQQITRQPEQPPVAAASPVAPSRWNPVLDDVCIPVAAQWEGLELAARQILNLKVGDVLQLDPQCAQQVKVRLGDHVRFNARLGTAGGQLAVELTGKLKL
jgi:flagellar motor switch protein FliM